VPQEARLFALLNMAEMDAGVACWEGKYHYNYWRPITGIRAADTDGNPDTVKDAGWSPLLATPAHPSYASGHSTVSSAAATVLGRFFGTDNVSFDSVAQNDANVTRHFTSFTQAAEEAGQSRIYGGFHWQFDNTAGQECGRLVGNWVVDHALTEGHHGRGNETAPGTGDQGQPPSLGQAMHELVASGSDPVLGTASSILA
jgi:hypothetical protein